MKLSASFRYAFIFSVILTSSVFATTYYSQNSLNPSNTNNWNTIPAGGGAVPPNFTSGDIFIIQNTHAMQFSSGTWTISGVFSKLIINSGGSLDLTHIASIVEVDQLQIDSGGALTISTATGLLKVFNGNGSGADFVVNGNIFNQGDINFYVGGTGEVGTTGHYRHTADGDTIPSFTWTGNAICSVTGMINSTTIFGLNQTFREFRWNCTGQTSNVQFNSQLISVNKLFWVSATGTAGIVLFNSTTDFYASYFDLTGGTIDFTTTPGISPTISINSTGTSFGQLAGTTIKTSGAGSTGMFRIGATVNNISQAGTIGPGPVGFHILPGAIVDPSNSDVDVTGDFIIDSAAHFGNTNNSHFRVVGSGNFELRKNGSFYIWDNNGLTTTPTLSGEVLVTGTRVFSSDANYYFWGTGAQVTGNATPATINGNVELWPVTSVTLTQNMIINGVLTIIDVPLYIGTTTLELNGFVVDSLNLLTSKGSIISSAGGTVIYNQFSTGQKIISNNSQYGNLSFSNFPKNLPTGVIKILGAFNPGASATHTVDMNDTIEFNGTGAQTISGFTYSNLIISGSRGANSITFAVAETVYISNIFSATASFTAGNYVTTNSFIGFNGIEAQSIAALSGGTTYHHLIVNKSASALTAGSALTIEGNLSLNNGIFVDGGNVITLKGNINGSAGVHVSSAGGKIVLTGSAVAHQISDVDLGTVDINDTNGASVIAAPGISDLLLTSGLFDITNGISILNAGTISSTSGSLSGNGIVYFNGSATVSGTISFYSVELSGAVDFGSGSIITNGMMINFGGSVTGNAPTYSVSALLKYSTGGTYSCGLEWSALSGAGYPVHVQLSNNTTLNLGNAATSTARQLSGNLTIDVGSTLSMNVGGSQMTAPLIVSGNVLNNGTLTLSSLVGGYIEIQGNYIESGLITNNGQFVVFKGSAQQSIERSGGGVIGFPKIKIDKASDTLKLSSSPPTNITISDSLVLLNGIFHLGGSILYVASNASIHGLGGNFVPNTGDVEFDGIGTVTGTVDFPVVDLFGAVDFGTGSTINQGLYVRSGGSVTANPPAYAVGSSLNYFSGGTYSRSLEWSATTGAGYPQNVTVQNNTMLNLGANSGTNTNRKIANTLNISSGSTLTMNGAGNEMLNYLEVLGNVTINGTLILSSQGGGDLRVGGDWTLSGTFTPNSGAVMFNGTNQSLTGTTTFGNVIINNGNNQLL